MQKITTSAAGRPWKLPEGFLAEKWCEWDCTKTRVSQPWGAGWFGIWWHGEQKVSLNDSCIRRGEIELEVEPILRSGGELLERGRKS